MNNTVVHIFYIQQAEELTDALFEKFLLRLPENFQTEIRNYKHKEPGQASLIGKIILQYGLERLNLNYSLHDILIGEKDRLFLNDTIDFNISHSGDFVICAIAQQAKVGIDIEKHRSLDVHLFRKYFDDKEWNEIQQSVDKLHTFFDLWSIKESAIKCDGRGVEVLSKTHKQYIDVSQITCDTVIFYYQQLAIAGNYSCCVCSNQKFTLNTIQLTLADLLIS